MRHGRWFYVQMACLQLDACRSKSRSGGTEDLYTSWLDAKGFSQLYKLDLDGTYVPLGKINIIHLHIAIAASKGGQFK